MMSKNIVFEGWLTKSPPSKRIWRTKWRRRWFALRQSGELPGQYFLDYYADRNYRRLKGTINLDLCEQVDAGLHMANAGNGSLVDPKLRGSVFTIQTQSRIYHLEADCESDMAKWVDAICRVCGLRATEETEENGSYQSNSSNCNVISNVTLSSEQTDNIDTTGPYIPISECITGIRAQDSQRAFTFDPKKIITSRRHSHLETFDPPRFQVAMMKSTLESVVEQQEREAAQNELNKIIDPDSENESNTDDDCKSLNTSQSNIHATMGPPVPPRPPKTLVMMTKEVAHKEPYPIYHGPKLQEPMDCTDKLTVPGVGVRRRKSHSGPPPSPVRTYGPSSTNHLSPNSIPTPGSSHHLTPTIVVKSYDDDDNISHSHQSLQYCNLPSMPPVVDRNLKPRPSSHSIPSGPLISAGAPATITVNAGMETRPDTLQYLDLDLMPKSSPTMFQGGRKVAIIHGKSKSANDADCAYMTVDFVKTEAFNITRQDAEASRNLQN